MRRPLVGVAVVVAVAAAWAPGLGVGCSHESKPVVQPDDHPPLPPASGTPIGYLVDASELKLRDDQLTQLKAIDEDLAGKLAVLDGELRGASPAAAASGQNTGRRRGGGRRGGGRRGGMAGGGGAGSGSGGGSASGTRPRPTGGAVAATTGRVTEERAADVRAAIDKALALLDITQRVIARRVLADHGVDVDAGRPTAPAEAEEPGEPDEPDPGSGSGSG